MMNERGKTSSDFLEFPFRAQRAVSAGKTEEKKTIYYIKTGVIKYISTRLLCFEFDFMGRAHFQALLKRNTTICQNKTYNNTFDEYINLYNKRNTL